MDSDWGTRFARGKRDGIMRLVMRCAYCRRVPRYKAGAIYLCTFHARYKRPGGLLPMRIW